MDRKYHIWVSQLCGFRRKSRESGYLASDCAMVSRQTDAAKFTLAEVASIVPTLDYDGCSLVELKVLEASIGAVVNPEVEQEAGAGSIDPANVRRLAAKLQNYDTCNDDDIDEAARLLLHLARVMRDRI